MSLSIPVPRGLFDGRLLEASSSCATNSLNNRVHISVSEMNLFAVNVDTLIQDDTEGVYNGDYIIAAVMNTSCRNAGKGATSETKHLGKPILHDTCFVLDINKTSGEGDEVDPEDEKNDGNRKPRAATDETLPLASRTDSNAGTFHVNGEIIGPLKVVLSKEIYEQILKTLDNLVYDDYEERLLRGEVGGKAKVGDSSTDSTTTTNVPPQRKTSAASEDAGAYDISLGQSPSDVVKIDFKLPLLQVELKGNFGVEEVSITSDDCVRKLKLRGFPLKIAENM